MGAVDYIASFNSCVDPSQRIPQAGLCVRHLGRCAYLPVFEAMQQFSAQRDDSTEDELWLLEHEAVFTLGRNGKAEHVLRESTIPIVNIDRGGQITYHAPGQLVIYVLLDIRRRHLGVRALVTLLETAVIRLLADYGVEANSDSKAPGVYVEGRKIAALGLRITRGCSYHGLSLNIDMDLAPFLDINPCGYAGLEVTQCRDVGIHAGFDELSQGLVKQLVALLPVVNT